MARTSPSSSRVSVPARRWGPGTSAIVRVLVAAREPLSGAAISRLVGVTQPRASQVIGRLVALGAAEATTAGYVVDRAALIDLYLSRSRPALADGESHWYGIRPLDQQAARILDLAAPGSVAFSADLGPDRLVPWRHPTVAVVYSRTDLPLSDTGLVPAEGQADASVILRHTTDPTLLSPAPGWIVPTAGPVGLALADPLQQLWDLTELGGDDRLEAADRLRRAIVDHSLFLPA